jgi:2-amino-4-hydroxy-6-hydroxymethyldihydropteridine diphosphokinase
LNLVYLGLGSNVGDSEALLRSALEKLNGPGLKLCRVSGLYETEPIGLREQRWFLNLVAEFETNLFPKQLLYRIRKVENELGRKRTVRNGPRTIDVDILLYGNFVVSTDELEIPHPRYGERRFTLAPLVELNPDLRDPVTGKTVSEMLASLTGQVARKSAQAKSVVRGSDSTSAPAKSIVRGSDSRAPKPDENG